jgi:hypothetical protein
MKSRRPFEGGFPLASLLYLIGVSLATGIYFLVRWFKNRR